MIRKAGSKQESIMFKLSMYKLRFCELMSRKPGVLFWQRMTLRMDGYIDYPVSLHFQFFNRSYRPEPRWWTAGGPPEHKTLLLLRLLE